MNELICNDSKMDRRDSLKSISCRIKLCINIALCSITPSYIVVWVLKEMVLFIFKRPFGPPLGHLDLVEDTSIENRQKAVCK